MKSFLRRSINKFRYAFEGLFQGICHDFSITLQLLIGLCVIVFCLFVDLTQWEWCIILVVIGAVIALEFVNSAIESVVDLVSPDYHILAKKAKDYAAAAVLVMSIAALVIGIIIIGGKIIW
ncbi:diacylglycerol kinase family protein [Erysipelotrichaceae bacterium HCN-30851]